MSVTSTRPPVDGMKFPDTDLSHELAAWYSGYAFYESYRKVVLASCEEIVRARYAALGVKISESRIETLSRLEGAYLMFLEKHLAGRILWEKAYLSMGFGR